MSEMLVGCTSLGDGYAVIERLERQAGDWEPFGDLLLTARTTTGTVGRCGVSVKSNRQVNSAGCEPELCAGAWAVLGDVGRFDTERDALALFGAKLAGAVGQQMADLCRRARENDPDRLDEKVVHKAQRKIYQSFRQPNTTDKSGLPGRLLARFVLREFDFEDSASRSEAEAVRQCGVAIEPQPERAEEPRLLWWELCRIAKELRVSGGTITRKELAARLRGRFRLRSDPCDDATWSGLRRKSQEWMDEVETCLPGGLAVPRAVEIEALRRAVAERRGFSVLGDTGSGKSALVKNVAKEVIAAGEEVIWIKAEGFTRLLEMLPEMEVAAERTRRNSGLLVFDAVEGCYRLEELRAIARMIARLTGGYEPVWRVVITSQTHDWSRIERGLIRELVDHPVLVDPILCGELAEDDFALVCRAHPSVARLAHDPGLRRLLRTPKMLDVLLGGQLAERRNLASEADLVEWWWTENVLGPGAMSADETVASDSAIRMADALRTELPPEEFRGHEDSVNDLVRKGVLWRRPDGTVRFRHDLLADWVRVMHLRSRGEDLLAFVRNHVGNPPWLRAIRLLSQHLLEREADHSRWRSVVAACRVVDPVAKEADAENLQVLDTWLEGIAGCAQPGAMLDRLKEDLLSGNCALLLRFVRRILHFGTVPDIAFQEICRARSIEVDEATMADFRLPIGAIWRHLFEFLESHSEVVTDCLPLEIAEIAAMWGRLQQYRPLAWSNLAGLALLNAEKEFRREIAGEFRHDWGRGGLSGRHGGRSKIYEAALHAASQDPERAARLVLKAAGRIPWQTGDLPPRTEIRWLGEWCESSGSVFGGGDDDVERPVKSWPDGPTREISDAFFHAWFHSGASLPLYRHRPRQACEATLAFVIAWPKRRMVRDRHHALSEQHGFTSEAVHMHPAFWSTGPFFSFLRHDWKPALDLIVRLVNFATDRAFEGWIDDPDGRWSVAFDTPVGHVVWRGPSPIYRWHRFHTNTSAVVTCALMALEKWLGDCIEAEQAVGDVVSSLYGHGRSLAFAGVLISVGKRFPGLFSTDLKPLLFAPELFDCDEGAVSSEIPSFSPWPFDPEVIRKAHKEWDTLAGRDTPLLRACCLWLVERPELAPVLAEVCAAWRQRAENRTAEPEARLELLRMASRLDRSLWNIVTLPDGREAWQHSLPDELRDAEGEASLEKTRKLLLLPLQCASVIERRLELTDDQLEALLGQVHALQADKEVKAHLDEEDSVNADPRHGFAGTLAVLVCLGADWLRRNGERQSWVADEVLKLLDDAPPVRAYSEDDGNVDCETFLARCAVRCWANEPANSIWRKAVGGFVTAYRYATIRALFDEAFRVRTAIGDGHRELEALALSFAAARNEANRLDKDSASKRIDEWRNKWLSIYSEGRGPAWTDNWAEIEVPEPFPHEKQAYPGSRRRRLRGRRDHGFDMGVLLGAFGQLPSLARANDNQEREHWITVTGQILAVALRTFPPPCGSTEEEERCDVYDSDRRVFEIVASRVFESDDMRVAAFWRTILDLGPARHVHVTAFLRSLLLESIRTEPPRISKLLALWRQIGDHLFASSLWTGPGTRGCWEVLSCFFLYGSSFQSAGDESFIPLIDGLRPLFERHVKEQLGGSRDQSDFVEFLTTKAGERLLVNALAWLCPAWERADHWFWDRAIERRSFGALLEHARRHHFSSIRGNPDALKSFKILMLQLSNRHVPIALEIQTQIAKMGTHAE